MKIIPVYTDQNKFNFSDHGITSLVRRGFTSFHTHQLKPGILMNLLGMSQTQGLLESGILDSTDSIDPNVSLGGVMLRVTKEDHADLLYYYEVENVPLMNFTQVGGSYRQILLNFKTKLRLFVGGEALKLGLLAFGSLNLELGDLEVHCKVDIEGDATYAVEAVGYDLNAFRVNYNRMDRRPEPHDKA